MVRGNYAAYLLRQDYYQEWLEKTRKRKKGTAKRKEHRKEPEMATVFKNDKQKEICAFIAAYTQQRGWSPAVREIGKAIGMTSTSHVEYHLALLEKGGYVLRGQAGEYGSTRRPIRLTDAGRALAGVRLVDKDGGAA
jgi:SOS-response transcriptional repressor LexA